MPRGHSAARGEAAGAFCGLHQSLTIDNKRNGATTGRIHNENTRRTTLQGMAGAFALGVGGFSLDYDAGRSPDARKRGGTLTLRDQRRDAALRLPRQRHLRDAALRGAVLFDAAALQPRQIPEGRRRPGAVLDGRAGPDDLHVQAPSEREIPRRHAADLGRREGDLRPAAQPAAGRGVDPQGDLRRHRHDRDARPAHRRLQDEGGERGDARAFRLAVELHLRGQGLAADPNCAARPRSTAPGRSPSSSTSRAATSPARSNENYFKKGLPYLDGFKGVFTLQAAAMLNAVQGGQVLAEFRGISPAERDRLVQAMGDKIRIEESSWTLNLLVVLQHREEAVRRRARAPGAADGDRPLGRQPGPVEDLDLALGRRRDPARLAAGDAGSRAGQAAGLLQGHQEVARGGQEAAGRGRRAEPQVHAAQPQPRACPTRRPASSWSTSGGRSASRSSTSSPTPAPYLADHERRQPRRGDRLLQPVHGRLEPRPCQVSLGRPLAGEPLALEGPRARQALRRAHARARSSKSARR